MPKLSTKARKKIPTSKKIHSQNILYQHAANNVTVTISKSHIPYIVIGDGCGDNARSVSLYGRKDLGLLIEVLNEIYFEIPDNDSTIYDVDDQE